MAYDHSKPMCGLLSVALALALASGASTGRAQSSVAEPSADTQIHRTTTLTIELEEDAPERLPVDILFGNQPQPTTHAEPLGAQRWRLTLFVHAAFGARHGLRSAAEELAQVADRLVSLADVEIVIADPHARTYLESTSNAEALRGALEWLSEEPIGVGEALDRDLAQGADWHAYSHPVLDWLGQAATQGPRAMVLLHEDLAGGEPLEDPLEDLAQALAVSGWTPFVAAQAAAPALSSITSALRSAGGRMLKNLTGLPAALARRRIVEVQLSAAPGEGVHELQFLPHDDGGKVQILNAPRWAAISTPKSLRLARANRLLAGDNLPAAQLVPRAALALPPNPAGTRGELHLLVPLDGSPRFGDPAWFRVTLLLTQIDEPPVARETVQRVDALQRSAGWSLRSEFDLPELIQEAVVLVEELTSGAWGGTLAQLSASTAVPSTVPSTAAPWVAQRADFDPATTSTATTSLPAQVIRILPPRRSRISGRSRFQILASTLNVKRIEFHLDGNLAQADDSAPFAAALDLGSEIKPHRIRAIAFDAEDKRLGEDSLLINGGRQQFEAIIRNLTVTPAGVQVSAQVTVPPDAQLMNAEFFWNDESVGLQESPPFEVNILKDDVTAQDYVRFEARLQDGRVLEDVRLAAAEGPSDRIDVNLVELYVVATDRHGTPVTQLIQDDFIVTQRGKPRTIQRFSPAEEIPLNLGLVIDSSESMRALMTDTRRAAGQFLNQILEADDQAFLVDFDTVPRLIRSPSSDVMHLIAGFGALQPDGYTALYDAVIFSLLQFDVANGRKALVLLTDGADYKSNFGVRRCLEYGRRLGVPVYILDLSGIDNPRGNVRKIDMEGLAEGTGGRVHYIAEMSQLRAAYERINNELRSQFILAYASEGTLADEELDTIKVRTKRKDLKVRAVVAGRRLGS